MDILVVGGGGREHAVIKKLKQSPHTGTVYCAPGNGGIAQDAICVPVKATDVDAVVALAVEKKVGLVVVTPDDPLMLGMVDALEEKGIRAFGPKKNAAEIEGSKVFSKNLMQRYHIPTAGYHVFDDPAQALAFIREQNSYPTVVKADGLALGKGVVIAETEQEAETALRSIMEDKIFGASGNRVVIEEFLTGPEVSVLSFTDGKTIVPMVSSKDHKRALDGNLGPNTGGMGTISPNPHYTGEMAEWCMKEIFRPTVEAMNREGRPFKGCLYFGLMLTADGPKVIEYNARFGDPETQVVLPRLKTDLVEIFDAVIDEKLDSVEIEWDDRAAACVVAASGGYPGKYETGRKITGLERAEALGNEVYHAGTRMENGSIVTSGGRVLGVTALGEGLDQALTKAYQGLSQIHFEGMYYRKDIGR
ncbi:MAG TPA: phosphoribosylamine--glycine ligase [Clostridia bacterium]|nr:phosphoribosylamine--glycine ligase [Clostridia bacterium]